MLLLSFILIGLFVVGNKMFELSKNTLLYVFILQCKNTILTKMSLFTVEKMLFIFFN